MLQKIKSLISDTALYGSAGLISQVAQFLLLPVFTRYLNPGDYGTLAISALIVLIFTVLANSGISNSVFRFYNDQNTDKALMLSTGTAWVIVASVLLGGASVLCHDFIRIFLLFNMITFNVFILSIGIGIVTTINEMPNVILRANRKVKAIFYFSICQLAVSLSLSLVLVVGFKVGILGVLWANMVTIFIFLLLKFYFIRDQLLPSISMERLKQLFGYGLPVVPHRILTVGVAQFGVYMVATMLSVEAAGFYYLAMKVVMPITFVIGSFQRAWVPYKFEIHAKDKDAKQFFRTMLPLYVFVISSLWVLVSLWGGEIIKLVVAKEFYGAAVLVPFVALVPVGQGFYYMLGTGFEFDKSLRSLPLVSGLGLITVIISGVFLTSHYVAEGAAIATFLAWLVMGGAILFLSQQKYRIEYNWLIIGSIIGFSALIVGLDIFYLEPLSVLVRVISKSLIVLVGALFAYVILFTDFFPENSALLWLRTRVRSVF